MLYLLIYYSLYYTKIQKNQKKLISYKKNARPFVSVRLFLSYMLFVHKALDRVLWSTLKVVLENLDICNLRVCRQLLVEHNQV